MVYITSDLFGPATTCDGGYNPTSTFWPAMANAQHTAALGKRKRHDGQEGPNKHEILAGVTQGPNAHHVSCNHQMQHRLPPSNREVARPQPFDAAPSGRGNHVSLALYPTPTNPAASERRPAKQLKRFSPKAMLVKSTSHLMDVEFDLPPTSQVAETQVLAVSDLRPCHACRLAPKRKKDLVNYLDCKRCDGRTCYICARECVGGCGKAVCKRCIIEVGQEGDSWCLDCYSRHINS